MARVDDPRRIAALDRQLAARRAAQKVQREMAAIFKVELGVAVRTAVTQGIVNAYQHISPQMAEFVKGLRVNSGEFKLIHERVGKMAQRSVLGSYDYQVRRNQSSMSRSGYRGGYRPAGGRLSGGVLRRALKNPQMVDAGPNHLYFINWNTLDDEAAHWYRLNFGAGARGQTSRQGRYNMLIEGQTILAGLGLKTGPSRKPVILPPGFFLDAQGQFQHRNSKRRGLDMFVPGGHRPGVTRGRRFRRTVTAGIEARNYLDAGVRRIALELPRAYDDLFRRALAERTGVTIDRVNVEVPGFKNRVRIIEKPSRAVTRFRLGEPL